MATLKKEANEDIEIFDEQQVLFEEKNIADENLPDDLDDLDLKIMFDFDDSKPEITLNEWIDDVHSKLTDSEKIELRKIWKL